MRRQTVALVRIVDVENKTAYVWGDGKQLMDWKLDEVMNDLYPSIRPTTLRAYVEYEGL